MTDQETYARTRSPVDDGGSYTGSHEAGVPNGSGTGSTVSAAATTAKDTAKGEARNVAQTAKQEAGAVVGEAKGQVQRLASQAKDQASTRVRGQHDRLVDGLRGLINEFEEMAGEGNSPAKAVVGDIAQRGHRVADYLADRGPEGLVSEVQGFARRRPLAFLAGAVAAGFLVGRLGKNVYKAQTDDTSSTWGAGSDAVGSQSLVAPVDTTPVSEVYADPYLDVTQPAAPVETTPRAGAWSDPPADPGTSGFGATSGLESTPTTPLSPTGPRAAEPFTPSPYASETYAGEETSYHDAQTRGSEGR